MTPIDRKQYLDAGETARLREFWQQRAAQALKQGKTTAVRTWLIVDFALATGLRCSEIQRVKVQDIDFQRGCLLNLVRSKKKDAKPETMALGPDLLEHLTQYVTYGPANGVAFAKSKLRQDGMTLSTLANGILQAGTRQIPLFYGQRGPLTTQGIARAWKSAVIKAGLPKEYAHIHCARHTFATAWIAKNGESDRAIIKLQRILGHESYETTVKMYVGIRWNELKESVSGLY